MLKLWYSHKRMRWQVIGDANEVKLGKRKAKWPDGAISEVDVYRVSSLFQDDDGSWKRFGHIYRTDGRR